MPKSVTFVAQGLSGGGAEMSMLRLAEDLGRNNYDVRIALLWKRGRLADAIPDAQLVEIDGIGHLLPVRAPAALARVVLETTTRAREIR